MGPPPCLPIMVLLPVQKPMDEDEGDFDDKRPARQQPGHDAVPARRAGGQHGVAVSIIPACVAGPRFAEIGGEGRVTASRHVRPMQFPDKDSQAPMVTLTTASVAEVKRILSLEQKDGWGLRLGVKAGGCSGLEYLMTFDEAPKGDDRVFDFEGVRVFVDPKSYLFLNGMTVDYSRDLLNGGFRFVNPNAKKSCSCGTSFSV